MTLRCPVTESMHRQRTTLIRDKLLILQREYRECLTVVWMTLHDPDSTALLRCYMMRLFARQSTTSVRMTPTERCYVLLMTISLYQTVHTRTQMSSNLTVMSYGLDVLFEKMSHDIMVNCETVLSQAFNEVSLENGHSLIAHIELQS